MVQSQQAAIIPQSTAIRPLTQEQQRALANIGTYARDYSTNLPDYMCVQTTHRDVQPAGIHSLPYGDEIRELVTFFEHRETYEVQSVNGKPAHIDHLELGGNVSSGEFGTLLQRIFDPASAADFSYARRTRLRGIPVDVFTYRVSKIHGYTMHSGPPPQEYISAWQGLIYANSATGAILRIRMECTGIPPDFPVQRLNLTLDYSSAKIGDRDYILPSRFELEQASHTGFIRNRAEYGSYRKFAAETRFSPAVP